MRRTCRNSKKTERREILEAEIPKEEGSKSSTPLITLLSYLDVYVQTQYFFELSRISERAEGRLRCHFELQASYGLRGSL